MATQRYISTAFWEDKWIRSLDPSERYLFMYLLTNPLTNIAGVYQITMERIAFDTGYDYRTLQPMFERLDAAGKACFFRDEWVVLPNWTKHQRVKERDNCRKGIDALLRELPDDVWYFTVEVGYSYKYLDCEYKPDLSIGIGRPLQDPSSPLQAPLHTRTFKGLDRPLNYSDPNPDPDKIQTPDPNPKSEPDGQKPKKERFDSSQECERGHRYYGDFCRECAVIDRQKPTPEDKDDFNDF